MASLDAEITDNTFHRYYYSGNFPKLTEELRECVIANSSIQENGVLIKHIPVKGGHLFWTEDDMYFWISTRILKNSRKN